VFGAFVEYRRFELYPLFACAFACLVEVLRYDKFLVLSEQKINISLSPLIIMASIVVVFDFDKTIIECDSDKWVVDELGFTDLFNQLFPTMPLNNLVVSL